MPLEQRGPILGAVHAGLAVGPCFRETVIEQSSMEKAMPQPSSDDAVYRVIWDEIQMYYTGCTPRLPVRGRRRQEWKQMEVARKACVWETGARVKVRKVAYERLVCAVEQPGESEVQQ